jgi:hypothetical protein
MTEGYGIGGAAGRGRSKWSSPRAPPSSHQGARRVSILFTHFSPCLVPPETDHFARQSTSLPAMAIEEGRPNAST